MPVEKIPEEKRKIEYKITITREGLK